MEENLPIKSRLDQPHRTRRTDVANGVEFGADDPRLKATKRWSHPFARRLREIQGAVDHVLAACIPESGASSRLNEAMRYAAVGGGKRLRTMLVVCITELLGGDTEQAIRVGAAIECVHAQSLIHDDLPCMDDDDFRRGKPTVHRRFDEATAVLAGDALLALAFEILGDEATHPEPAVRIALVSALASAIGRDGVASGQMMDLYPPSVFSDRAIRDCAMRKTARLFRFAAQGAIALARYSSENDLNILAFADKVGLAFQLRDDLLDVTGELELVGKRLNKDELAGRDTLVQTFGVGRAVAEAETLIRSARSDLRCFGPAAQPLEELAAFAIARSH